MLTCMDLHSERPLFSASIDSGIVQSADAPPPGVSMPALKAASFMGGHSVGVDMQPSHIAAFARRCASNQLAPLQTSVRIPAAAAAAPALLQVQVRPCCRPYVRSGVAADQEFAAAFAAALPVLEVVALLPRLQYCPVLIQARRLHCAQASAFSSSAQLLHLPARHQDPPCRAPGGAVVWGQPQQPGGYHQAGTVGDATRLVRHRGCHGAGCANVPAVAVAAWWEVP